ncbi:hypothetical protein ACFQ3W_23190 [Paenibacillus puldeungensis]|uniref:BclA C-terminal domain-containing protein n=1 Tax=Paenibacillus puldeungensis TaxID=696536 RepID=A0ABW3S3X3_9BACL
MPVTLNFPYTLGAGVGQGFYVAADPPGTSGIVTVSTTTGTIELRITRYNATTFTTTVPAGTTFAVSIGNIQTIGIFAVTAATGTLSFITNVF